MSDPEDSAKSGEEGEEGEEKKVEVILGPKPDPEEERKKVETIFRECLSEIDLTAEGDSYAFTKLTIDREGIKDLYDILGNYPHLRSINCMGNEIKDISSIVMVPYLLTLDVSRN